MEEEEWGNDGTQLEGGDDSGSASDGNETLADDDDYDAGHDLSVGDTQLVVGDTAREVDAALDLTNNLIARAEEEEEEEVEEEVDEEEGTQVEEPASRQPSYPGSAATGAGLVNITSPDRLASGYRSNSSSGVGEEASREPVVRHQHCVLLGSRDATESAAVALADQQNPVSHSGGGRAISEIDEGAKKQSSLSANEAEDIRNMKEEGEEGLGSEGARAESCAAAQDDHGRGCGGSPQETRGSAGQADPVECETQPTQVDSPHAQSPPAADAVVATTPARNRKEDTPEGVDPQHPGVSTPPSLSPEIPTTTRQKHDVAPRQVRAGADVESRLGPSELRVESQQSFGCAPSAHSAERRPPSPPRRTGQGSGVFLAREVSACAGAVADAAELSPPETSTPPPSSPDLPRDKVAAATAKEAVASALSPMVLSSTSSTIVGPASPEEHAAAASAAGGGVVKVSSALARYPKANGQAEGIATGMSPGGGTSAGFLSSAEPSAKLVGALASSASSPQPLPRGWLDGQLTAAAAAQEIPSARTRRGVGSGDEDGGRGRRSKTGLPIEGKAPKATGAATKLAISSLADAPVTQVPKKPSPGKAVAGPGGWIQTKGSVSKGSSASAAAGGGGGGTRRAVRDVEEGSLSQNILAICVPQERRVSVLRPQPVRAVDGLEPEDGFSQPPVEEDDTLGTPAEMTRALNTQDINPDDFSQIEKDYSQERRELERLLDQAIAEGNYGKEAGEGGSGGELLSSQPSVYRPSVAGAETDPTSGARPSTPPVEREDQRLDSGGGGGLNCRGRNTVPVKRKKMRSSVPVVAGRAEMTPGGGAVRTGGFSRTPGAYVGGSGSKSSAKKRAVPSHPLDGPIHPTKSVFDIPSDGDGNDSDDGAVDGCLSKPRAKAGSTVQRVSKSAASRDGAHAKRAGGDEPPDRAALLCRGDTGGYDESGGLPSGDDEVEAEDAGCADVRDLQDEGEGEGGPVLRTEQDLQMERAMAAIRKDLTPVSSAPDRLDSSSRGGEDEMEEEEEEEEEGEARRGGNAANRSLAVSGRGIFATSGCQPDSESTGGARDGRGGYVESRQEGTRPGEGNTHRAASRSAASAVEEVSPVPELGGENGRGAEDAAVSVTAEYDEPPTYKTLFPFLEEEGWSYASGKGLHTWFYLIPGKGGRNGKVGVDFLVSEEDVVRYVCRDKEALVRFRAYRRELDGNSADGGSSNSPGGGRSATVGKSERAEGGAPPGDHGIGEAVSARKSLAAKPGRGRRAGGEVVGPGSNTGKGLAARGRGTAHNTSQASGRADRQAPEASPREWRDWEKRWPTLWPKLQEDGWHWVYGSGLASRLWLKRGVSKSRGTLGVDMFDSKEAVVAHVFGVAASERGAEGALASDREPIEVGRGEAKLQEWGLTRNRSKRHRNPPKLLGDTPLPEVVELPKNRKVGRKPAPLPPVPAVLESRSSIAPSVAGARRRDEQPTGGEHSRPITSPAQGKERGRPPKRPLRNTVAPLPKRARVEERKKLPPGDPSEEGDSKRWDESGDDGDAAELDPEEMDCATQPQYELALAINIAEMARGGPATSPAEAAAAAVVAGGGAADGSGVQRARGGAAGAESEVASATEREVGNSDGARAMFTASASTPSRKYPPGASTPRSRQPPPVAAASAATAVIGCNGDVNNGGGGGGSVDRTPSRQESRPLERSPSSSGSAHGGGRGGDSKRRRRSPFAGDAPRASSRRQGPFSGLGVIVTGIRGEGPSGTRVAIEKKIKKLGGQVVQVFGKGGGGDDEWRKWLLSEAGHGGGSTSSKRSDDGRRMIAVATPDSDRTPKFQLALAAGMPIVHPSYVNACFGVITELDPTPYLLPLGRSALGDRRLIMPLRPSLSGGEPGGGGGGGISALSRERPFQGKAVLLYVWGSAGQPSADKWVFTLKVAGAAAVVTTFENGGGGGGGSRKATASSADLGRQCTLEAAHALMQEGKIYCVIAIRGSDGSGSGNNVAPAQRQRMEAAALQTGTAAGTLEWAIQCMAHERLLVPNAGTCPWFPLGAAAGGGGSGGANEADEAPSGKDRKGKGRGGRGGRSRGGGARSGTSGASSGSDEASRYHIHSSSSGKRYLAGDYVLLGKGKGAASNAPAVGAGGAGGEGDAAASLARVARILSFERGRDRKVRVWVTAMERGDDGSKVLVAGEKERVGEEMLGVRVVAMTRREMETTQIYSMNDPGIFCLADEAA